MPDRFVNWSTQQLAEFLAAVSAVETEEAATIAGIERMAEALEAEVAAIVRDGAVAVSVGFADGRAPDRELLRLVESGEARGRVPGLPECAAMIVPLGGAAGARVLLLRASDDFDAVDRALARSMARILTLALQTLRTLETERSLRRQSELQARENATLLTSLLSRQKLLERTSEIQRAISRRIPLHDVLEAIVTGASELFGGEAVALRMVDASDPTQTVLVASTGVSSELRRSIERGRVGEGAGGRAIAEGALVVMDDYATAHGAVPQAAADRLQAAMAAPVHERGTVIGSLAVGTYRPGRTYGDSDRQMLLAFAEHASLAMMDAKTVDAMVHQALHDSLTGLPNRKLFLDRLGSAVEREADALAVLFLDLDKFKNVNDSLGHAVGDELLVRVAERLRGCIRASDTAARLGGDEFAVLLEDAGDRMNAARLAERICTALRGPFVLDEREIFITASVGIALSGGAGDDLLRNADLAMYRAKTTRTGYAFYERDMHAAVTRRLELEADLHRAVREHEFELHYQPIVELRGGKPVGAEALLRWRHPERGLVPPADFIGVVEDMGASTAIGGWAIREACVQAARWQRELGGRALAVSVNVSSAQLRQPTFVADVAAALSRARLEPRSLVLELTETSLMTDPELAVERLRALKRLGVRLAVDDFGTGHSSLRYLREFPIDVLKIAKPFVDDVTRGREESALARAIIDLGQTFALDVVAEGIERVDQLSALRALGCPLGQGFLLAEAVTSSEAAELLASPIVPRPRLRATGDRAALSA